MTTYQKNQIKHLQGLGWSNPSSTGSSMPYRLTNKSGHRAYIYSAWTQYII